MKRIMLYTAIVLATFTLLFFLWQIKLVLLLFVLSLMVAAAIRPGVDWFVNKGLPPAVAQVFLYLIGILGLFFLLFIVGDLLLAEWHALINWGIIEYEALYTRWQAGAVWQQFAVNVLPTPLTPNMIQNMDPNEVIIITLNLTVSLAGSIAGLVLLLAMSLYWSLDQHRFERLFLSLWSANRRIMARDIWRALETRIGTFLRIQFMTSTLFALFMFVIALGASLDFPISLAIFGALAMFLPMVGGLITAGVAFILGYSQSLETGIVLLVLTLLLTVMIELITSRLWPGQARKSTLLTIILLIPLFEAFGLVGFVIAPALSIALQALIRQVYWATVSQKRRLVQYDELQTRVQSLQGELQEPNGLKNPQQLQSLTQRLADLLTEYRNQSLDQAQP